MCPAVRVPTLADAMSRKILKKPNIRPVRFPWTEDLSETVRAALKLPPENDTAVELLAESVKQLSDRFLLTGISPYADTPDFLRAYVSYYLPVNVPKIADTLLCSGICASDPPGGAPPEGSPESRQSQQEYLRVLDLGTGPGTALIALLLVRNMLNRHGPLDITATDRTPAFLEAAEALVTAFRHLTGIPGSNRFLLRDIPDIPPGPFDCVMMANVMAELTGSLMDRFHERLETLVAPGGAVLLMEPAQRRVARALHALRDALNPAIWHILYPCPGAYPCPALTRDRDWCHHRLAWDPPETVRCIDRNTRMNKQFLNFTPLVLRRRDIPGGDTAPEPPVLRVISDVRILKGKLEVLVCGEFGDDSHLRTVMLENKKMTRYNEMFTDLVRYDRIRIEHVEVRGDRLILSETSRLTCVVDDGDRE